MTNPTEINLLNFDRPSMQAFFVSLGEKAFRGDQVFKWLHQLGVTEFEAMTDLSQSLRQYLQHNVTVKIPEVAFEQASQDGTYKWLLRLEDGNCIETVVGVGYRFTGCSYFSGK